MASQELLCYKALEGYDSELSGSVGEGGTGVIVGKANNRSYQALLAKALQELLLAKQITGAIRLYWRRRYRSYYWRGK